MGPCVVFEAGRTWTQAAHGTLLLIRLRGHKNRTAREGALVHGSCRRNLPQLRRPYSQDIQLSPSVTPSGALLDRRPVRLAATASARSGPPDRVRAGRFLKMLLS